MGVERLSLNNFTNPLVRKKTADLKLIESQIFIQQRWVYSRSAETEIQDLQPWTSHVQIPTWQERENTSFVFWELKAVLIFWKVPKYSGVGVGQSHRLWKPEMTQEGSSVLKAEASGTHSFIRYLLCSFCARFCTGWSENQWNKSHRVPDLKEFIIWKKELFFSIYYVSSGLPRWR